MRWSNTPPHLAHAEGMKMPMKIIMAYLGGYQKQTGLPQETVEVSGSLRDAVEQVQAHLRDHYEIQPPYIMIYANKHIIGALKQQLPLRENAVFRIMPFVSGG